MSRIGHGLRRARRVVSSGGGGSPVVDVYGMPWHSDSLNNVPIGSNDPANYAWALRFKSKKTGQMAGVRVYFVDNSALHNDQGYAKGNGGTIEVKLRPDDGSGWPNMAVTLATFTKTFPTMSTGFINPRDTPDKIVHLFGFMTWPSPVAITEGEHYHICFENRGASPTVNWVSINNAAALGGGVRAPSAPGTEDWGLIGWNRDNFLGSRYVENENAYQPIFEVGMTDGSAFGMAWMDNFSGARRAITGTNRVRQLFTPTTSMDFTHIGFNLIQVSAAGSVVAQLKQGTTVLQSVTVAATEFAGSSSGVWVEKPFTASVAAGTQYAVEFSASGCNLNASPLQDGSEFWGWDPEAGWANAWAQSSSNGGSSWVGWHTGGQTDLAFDQGDLPVYFKTYTDAAGGGTGPMNVLALPGIHSWYDPSLPAPDTYTATGEYLYIKNRQGDATRDLNQLTGGQAPAVQAAVMNGLSAPFFDGVNDFLGHNAPGLYAAGACTVVAVMRGAAQIDRHVIGEGASAGVGIYTIIRNQNPNVNGAPDAYAQVHGAAIQYPGYGDGTRAAWVAGQTHVVMTIDTGSVISHYVDGVLSSSHAYSRASGAIAVDRFTIGCLRFNNNTFQHWAGNIGEVVCCTQALGTTDRERLEGYLAHKWGSSAYLPVGHPFKSAPPS